MEPRKDLVNKLLNQYNIDDSVLGVILVGSAGKGYQDEYSDIDLEVVVTENQYDTLEKNSQKIIHTKNYDLTFTTINKLQQVKESERDEDHWRYRDCPVLLDKTDRLKGILRKMTRYNMNSRLDRLKRYYLGYWENSLNAMGCLRHKNDWGARIYAALAMQELIRLLFNFNYHWAPKVQWAFREIHLLQRKPINLESQIVSILTKPNLKKLSTLWDETAKLLREEKHVWVDHPEEIL